MLAVESRYNITGKWDVGVHGDPRSDDWFWLRERDDPEVLAHLRAENAYSEAWFAPLAGLRQRCG